MSMLNPAPLPALLIALCLAAGTAAQAQVDAAAPDATATDPTTAGAAAATDAAATNPTAVVERLHAALLESMRGGDALGQAGRSTLLAPVIAASFDFPTIARIVTGAAWKKASAAQREAFLDVFARLTVATYASNFSSHAGERFVSGESSESRGARIVRSELVKSDGERIALDYMLHQRNDSWRIVNVVAQGVSDLSLKRAEYTAVIEDDGLDTLITRLEEKVSELSH